MMRYLYKKIFFSLIFVFCINICIAAFALDFKADYMKSVSALNHAFTLHKNLTGETIASVNSADDIARILEKRLNTKYKNGTIVSTVDGTSYTVSKFKKGCKYYNEELISVSDCLITIKIPNNLPFTVALSGEKNYAVLNKYISK